ncbi:MAG: GGDEF domain-containing protein [Pseudobutyrivibrio sp.]|nr:GGDEF domain-containing protein [Pseudobutyrivibrio sp.]
MIAVCRSSGDVNNQVFEYVLPVIGICIFVAVFFGIIMIRYIRVLGDRISKMDRYMNRLASGEFDSEMPRELMADDDEIKSLATDGKKMAKAIKMLVDFDALTELNNRRSADKRMEECRIKMVEQGNKYCVCIADIDFFKKVNDTYGHDMGDVVLRMVASTLKSGMVGKGFVARWGGEEFLLIFDNRELDIAYRELNMIMDEIRTIIIPETDRQVTTLFSLIKIAICSYQGLIVRFPRSHFRYTKAHGNLPVCLRYNNGSDFIHYHIKFSVGYIQFPVVKNE